MTDIIGTDGDDELSSNQIGITIYGLGGNDTLSGGSGVWLNGGPGADILEGAYVTYKTSAAGVTIDLSATPDADGYVSGRGGDAQGDKLHFFAVSTVEGSEHADRLIGGSGISIRYSFYGLGGNDTLIGGDNPDWLFGGPGNDTLEGGPGADALQGGDGADTLDGGADIDTVWYDDLHSRAGVTATTGVTIDLSATPDADGYVSGRGGDAQGDKLKNIENLVGSRYGDRLTGDDFGNSFDGRDGDDTLKGGPGDDSLFGGPGADTLDGGSGEDYAGYSDSVAGVTIDLSATPDADGYVSGRGGEAQGDKLKNIENFWGSRYGDRLTGDGLDNELWGDHGDDLLNGGHGDDKLDGFHGNDTLNGGPGDDLLIGDDGADTLNGGPGDDRLIGGNEFGSLREPEADRFVFDAGSGHDVIEDFELGVDKIQFSESGITFTDLRLEVYTGSSAGGTVVSWNSRSQSITLTGVADTSLTEDSFLFSDDTPTDIRDAEPFTHTADENSITGTAGNDNLSGTAGADTMHGLAGDDKLYGSPGADVLDGGPGFDTASYKSSAAAVLVRLHDARAVRFGDAEGDTLTGIEHLVGSEHNDILAGDGEDNRLEGKGGNDDMYGGPAGGDDEMLGGDGDDRIFGGRGNDTLTGGEGNDLLKGGPGDDVLIVDGDDMDVVNGGPGEDIFRFFPSDLGGGSIQDFTDGEDKIDLTAFTNINSMDDLDIEDYGDNVRIEVSGTDYLTTIILSDFDVNNLDNADFMF